MAYADKCFYFDWGNREIKLEDFDKYDSISLRKRWYGEEGEIGVSIELWGKEKEGDEREEDSEIVLSRDNAMILANKLMRAVAELDADLYREGDLEDLRLLLDIFSDEVDEEKERRWNLGHRYSNPKGGLMGALTNFVDTPRGKDTLKKMEKADDDTN